MVDMTVSENTEITLHFSLSLSTGDLVDSNFDAKPATFVYGDGSLLPGFEKKLIGLRIGDQEEFTVPPEAGFGQPNPNNIQVMKRSTFSDDVELAEGLMLSFSDAAGGELPGVVKSFDDNEVSIDFNHPLAGRNILFKVHILDIKPSTTH